MKAIKKISLILCLTIALTGMTGCGKTKTEQKPESNKATQTEKKDENKKTRTITDHAGNKVEVPEKIERIVIDQIPILSTYMAYHHGKAPDMLVHLSK